MCLCCFLLCPPPAPHGMLGFGLGSAGLAQLTVCVCERGRPCVRACLNALVCARGVGWVGWWGAYVHVCVRCEQAEVVMSVKQGLRKTGIDVTTPTTAVSPPFLSFSWQPQPPFSLPACTYVLEHPVAQAPSPIPHIPTPHPNPASLRHNRKSRGFLHLTHRVSVLCLVAVSCDFARAQQWVRRCVQGRHLTHAGGGRVRRSR